VRGKGRGSTRGSWATCGWSRGGSGWPESSCPRRAGPAAGGTRRRGGSGVRGRKRRAGELQWGTGKVGALSIWGGKERRGKFHGDRAHGGNNGGGKLLYARGEGLERPFIGKRSGKGKHGKLGSSLGSLPGEVNLGGAAAAGAPACSSAQAPWRAAGRQQGRGEAVDEQRDDAWTGKSRGMDDGGQGRGTAPAAGAPVVQRRRTEEQGAGRKKGMN
jgi:hypothetical protein